MGRTEGSKNGTKKKTQPKNKKVSPFLYDSRSSVIYLGNMYDGYKNAVATVVRRSVEKGYYKWYFIEFADGKRIHVKEDWIKENS